jgi:hypothetical protein
MGEVTYSPEKGVLLSYTIAGHNEPEESNLLYGILTTGEKCTLVGKFNPQSSGFSFNNGLSTRNGEVHFSCLVIGDFLKENELFHDINFSLTGMQEFFFPKGYKDLVKFSEKPLFSINTSFGKVEVGNNASFGFLHKDISAQIYSRNKEALDEVAESFSEIESKHPDANFMLKKDIAYRIHLKFDSGSDIISSYSSINDISNLFSVLIYSPVYPDSIKASKTLGDNKVNLDVYPSMSLSDRTINLCFKDRSHFHMPITKSNMDFEKTVSEWLDSSDVYSTIVSSIQNETGYRDLHSVHGEIVLYATQFEIISFEENTKEKKYEYPIDNYGTKKIKNGILSIFKSAGVDDIGIGISGLRNEIAHVGRPKKLLKTLTVGNLMFISKYMQMTVLGFMLNQLGIKKEIIDNYQNNFTPES